MIYDCGWTWKFEPHFEGSSKGVWHHFLPRYADGMWLSQAYLQLRPLAALSLGDPSILALDHLRNAWSPCPLSLPFTFAPWLRHRKVGLVESIHEIQQSQQVWPLVLMIHQSLTSLKDDILHHITSYDIILHHITSYYIILHHIYPIYHIFLLLSTELWPRPGQRGDLCRQVANTDAVVRATLLEDAATKCANGPCRS